MIDIQEAGEFSLRLEPMAQPREAVANLLGVELRRLSDDELADPVDQDLLE